MLAGGGRLSNSRAFRYPAGSTAVLFPSEQGSRTFFELSADELAALRTLVVVDSKWTKTGGV